MKKQTCILFSIVVGLLLLTSCTPEQTVSVYGELNYPGLSWMMNSEEAFEAMGKAETDFQKAESGTAESMEYEVYYTTDGKLFGKDAEIRLTFLPTADGESLSLWTVSAIMKDTSQEHYTSLCKELISEFAKQEAQTEQEQHLKQIVQSSDEMEEMEEIPLDAEVYQNDEVIGFEKTYRFTSVKQTVDLPQEIQEKWKEGTETFYEQHPSETPVESFPQWTLSTAEIVYTERRNTGEKELCIWFSGTGLCNILKYVE